MKCLDCQYDLSAITSNKCPECGRAFDSKDGLTFLSGEPTPTRQVLRGVMYVGFASLSGAFVIHLLAGYAALIAARIDLGRWPDRTGKDVPAFINWFVNALHWIWIFAGGLMAWLILLCGPSVVITGTKMFLASKRGELREHRAKVTLVVAAAIAVVGMMLHYAFDPARLVEWMMK